MRAQLYSIRELPAGRISIMARPRGGDWLIDEIKALYNEDVHVLVSLLTRAEIDEFDLDNEAAFCQQHNIVYLSFPIIDRSVPAFSDTTFVFLQQLQTYLSQNKQIAIHCRQALGRAVLIAASLLVLNNFSPKQAFLELSRVRGYPVPETEEQKAWVESFWYHHSSINRLT